MHINNDFSNDIKIQKNTPFQEVRENSPKESETAKNGDVLKGKVIDISSDKISVRLDSGGMISARLPNESHGSGLGEVKIGDNINLRVTEKNGQQSLEIVVSKSDARQHIIGMALNAAGLKLTDENAKLVELLLGNQKPIDANTIKKFNQALKLVGQENVKQALFMMDNDMPITKSTAEKIEQYVNREQNIKHQFAALEQAVEEMENGPLKDHLIEILADKGENQNIEKAANQSTEQLADEPTTEAEIKLAQKSAAPVPQVAEEIAGKTQPGTTEKMPETIAAQKQPLQQPQEQQERINLPEPAKQVLKSGINNILSLLENSGDTNEQKIMQLMSELKKTPLSVMKNINSVDDFKELLKIVSENDSELSSKINELINEEITKEDTPEKSSKRLAPSGIKITKDSVPKELEDFYNNTITKLISVKEALQQSESPSASKIMTAASDIEKNLEFLNTIKNEIYLQAPIIINNLPTQGELFIFKDKKSSKKGGQTKSALIALDLLNLGHFETYIQKTGNKVNFQFRLEKPDVEKLVKSNINKLNLLLQEKGLSVSTISYKTIEEPFTLVDSESSITSNTDNEKSNAKRISFDIRT